MGSKESSSHKVCLLRCPHRGSGISSRARLATNGGRGIESKIALQHCSCLLKARVDRPSMLADSSSCSNLDSRAHLVTRRIGISNSGLQANDFFQSSHELNMSSLSRRACYKCGNVGHYAEVCSSSERLCYNCKEPGKRCAAARVLVQSLTLRRSRKQQLPLATNHRDQAMLPLPESRPRPG